MKVLSQAVGLLLITLLISVAAYFARPDAGRWDAAESEITVAEARTLTDAIWIDARADDEFEAGHYPGALSLNEENWEQGFAPLLEVWRPEATLVVYCSSESCLRSHQVADRLRAELGVETAFALQGGWEAMIDAGLVKGGAR